MRKLLVVILFGCALLQVQCQNAAPIVFDRQELADYLCQPNEFRPIPQAKDTFWHQTLPQEMRTDYIRLGHSYKGCSWDYIPDSVFREYRTNGNRRNYQRLNFGIRRQMACLVMAEIMEHRGELLDDILRGLDYFNHETWWGISAHYPTSEPQYDNQYVDLFNAETANMLAWTIYMLHDELEEVRPGVCEAVSNEIERRFLKPARTKHFNWKTKVDNHNTWICANWLSCILLCEKDRNQQISDINQVLSCLEIFFDGYPDDGGCDEGVHYWDRAAASLYESVRLLEIATNGHVGLSDNPRFKAMGSFVYKTYITKNACVNFADTPSNTKVHIHILYPFGQYIGDSIMTGYAAMIANETNYKNHPSNVFLQSGNYPSISRELMFLGEYKSFEEINPREPLLRDMWLPNLQIFTARSFGQSGDGLYLAGKGGHNAERHNHNDVGNFIVYSNDEPLIIDIGFATYDAKTFSNKRYELMNNRSAFHNVPLINGVEQHNGKSYCAKNVNYFQSNAQVKFSLDLENAYPSEAKVKRWQRTIQMRRGDKIEVTEEYELEKYLSPTDIVLICCGDVSLEKPGRIVIKTDKGVSHIIYNSKQLSQGIEPLVVNDPVLQETWHDKTLYRVKLTIINQRLKGKVKYSIE